MIQKLDQEQIDALKLDTQTVGPEDYMQIKKLLAEVDTTLEDITGVKLNSDTKNRIILTDSDIANLLVGEWSENAFNSLCEEYPIFGNATKVSYTDDDFEGIQLTELGDFMVVKNDKDYWNMMPEPLKEQIMTLTGLTQVKAENFTNSMIKASTIIHEYIHSLMRDSLPLWINEIVTRYLSSLIVREIWGFNLLDDVDRNAIEKFEELLASHSSNLYFALLNSEHDFDEFMDIWEVLYKTSISEIREVFPEYQDPRKERREASIQKEESK